MSFQKQCYVCFVGVNVCPKHVGYHPISSVSLSFLTIMSIKKKIRDMSRGCHLLQSKYFHRIIDRLTKILS